MRLLLWILLAILGLAVVVGAVGGWMGWGWHGGGMMAVGPLFMLLPVLLIVVLVYALTDRSRRGTERVPGEREPGGPDALAVAKQRYAAGEIGRDKFLKIKEDIEGESEP